MANQKIIEIADPKTARAEIEYLVGIGRDIEAAQAEAKIVDVEGHKYLYSLGNLKLVEPVDDKYPDCFTAFSLTGLVDYIKADVDSIFDDLDRTHIVRVTDVKSVEILSPVTGPYKRRITIGKCKALVPEIDFKKFMDPEDFQIMVQTRFMETENRALVLKLVGSLRTEQEMKIADDGVSQRVTINRGTAIAGDVIVKNPVHLIPLRTFHEVEQPESPFVIRFNDEAQAALFEADGGAWQLEAAQNIRDWLKKALEGRNVEVIA